MSTFYRESGKYKPYELQHRFRRRLLFIFKIILIIFLIHLVVTSIFVTTFRNNSESMLPGIRPGEYFLVSPFVYGPRIPFTNKKIFTFNPPKRGELVLYLPAHARPTGVLHQIADPFVRFFTLNKIISMSPRVRAQKPQYMIRRVIGIPGDTVKVTSEGIFIKPDGGDYYFSEYEKIESAYDVRPLNNKFIAEKIYVLAPDHYFVLGDNRDFSLDSMNWGGVSGEYLIGKVILRYFPFNRFGTP